MKRKAILFLLMILFLSPPQIIYAQQGEGQSDATGGEQPLSYMFGKEHYLPDSPEYMVGKKHYLPERSFSKNGGNVRENGEEPVSKGGTGSSESGKSGDPGRTQVEVEINFFIQPAITDYGIIFPAVVSPRHHGKTTEPFPKVNPLAPDTGNFNPNVRGGQIPHHSTGDSNPIH